MMNPRILILCTGNSARSQMAEGLLRELSAGKLDVFSAGSKPSTVNPFAIQAMRERGIDISGQRSKHLNEYLTQPFDYVITVCDEAGETCPVFPGRARRIHWSFPDPAARGGSDEMRLATFRETRDALEGRLKTWLEELAELPAAK
ncbi:MAG TPA: arsenate reductase ArsC [Aggregatilineales bacterium]|nr:arsenate reductase ArsC [Aggregatilineales bacterium]